MSGARFDQCPIGSVRLETVIRDPEQVSPRRGLGAARVSAERVAEFKQMLGEDLRALPEPICVESQGSLILADGHHRVAALEQLAREYPGDRRFEFISIRVANTPSGLLPSAYAYEIALECSAKGPLPLTRAEKHVAIARLLEGRPTATNREIARLVGVSHHTVEARRRETGGQSPTRETVNSNGSRATSTSPARVARIAAQIVRYGVELGAEDSNVGYDETVAELAYKCRELHPTTARDWAEWWEGMWGNVRAELEAGA